MLSAGRAVCWGSGEVGGPAGDVEGVSSEAVVAACHEGGLHGGRGGGALGGQFGGEAGVQAVHFLVEAGKGGRGGGVALVPRVGCLLPHAAGEVTHLGSDRASAGGEVGGEAGMRGDLHDQVVGSFEFGGDSQD